MQTVIITPVEIEYRQLRELLSDRQSLRGQDGQRYETGLIDCKTGPLPAAIHLSGSKTVEVALAAEKAIRQFQPDLILLAGIAGGVKDAAIGDIVVGTKAYGYESGKEGEGSFSARPDVYGFDREFVDFVREFALQESWQHQVTAAQRPQVYFGPIASGEKLVASVNGDVSRLLATHYNDTVALEMEASGFAKAVHRHRHVRGANIRGISDLLGNKSATDRQGGQDLAMTHLFHFLRELFLQLDPDQFKTPDRRAQERNLPPPTAQPPSTTVNKNTITGSTINVGGNFHLGDIHRGGSRGNTPDHGDPPAIDPSSLQALKNKIGRNRLDEVIRELLALLQAHPAHRQLHDDTLQIKRRLSDLRRRERISLISFEEAGRGHNQITYALLNIISELQ